MESVKIHSESVYTQQSPKQDRIRYQLKIYIAENKELENDQNPE